MWKPHRFSRHIGFMEGLLAQKVSGVAERWSQTCCFKRSKVILIYGNGAIGQALAAEFGKDAVVSTRRIAHGSYHAIFDEVQKYTSVVNCVGKTGRPNVDWCEDHRQETWESNVIAAKEIAFACRGAGVHFTHISSGCIYDGDIADEYAPPNYFGSFYSVSKIAAEEVLAEYKPLILRIRMPLFAIRNQRNLLDKLLNYPIIHVGPNSITVIPDAVPVMAELIRRRERGPFNIVNPGAITNMDMIHIYEHFSGFEQGKKYVDPEFRLTEAGRSQCVLASSRLDKLGLQLPTSFDSATRVIRGYLGL